MKETKTFTEWIQYTKPVAIRKWVAKETYVVLDIDTLELHYFDNLQIFARAIGRRQIHTYQYDNLKENQGIINMKYRVFSRSFFDKNEVEIYDLPRYLVECFYKEEYARLGKHITYLDGSKSFLKIKDISDHLGMNRETIRLILNGKTIKNDFDIRYCNYSHEYKHEMAIKHSNTLSRNRSKNKYKTLD